MHLLFPPNGVLLHFLPCLDWLEAYFIKFSDLPEPESLYWSYCQRELLREIVLFFHISELKESESLSTLFRHTFQWYIIKRLLVLLAGDYRSRRECLPDEFNDVFLNPVLVDAYDA